VSAYKLYSVFVHILPYILSIPCWESWSLYCWVIYVC